MKRFLIIWSMFAGMGALQAQTTASITGSWGDNEPGSSKSATKIADFEYSDMAYSNKTVTISGLPETKKPIFAVITSASGDFVKQKKINPTENNFRVDELKTGLYFVNIVYRQKGKKAFVLNIE